MQGSERERERDRERERERQRKTNGGEPFVLLFEPIAFGSPTGGKEIDVVVNP